MNNQPSGQRYILYTRVSTAGQDDNYSHDTQLAALERYVEVRSGVVAERIRETASGGSYLARPGIQRALEMLECNEADVLGCFDFSRYSRDEEHQQAMVRRIERAGKRVEFTTMALDWDVDGKLSPDAHLMFGVQGTFAAYQRRKIRADSMRGSRAAAEAGIQPSAARSPLGYRIVTKADIIRGTYPADMKGRYVFSPLAPAVAEAFRMAAAGVPYPAIVTMLDEAGAKISLSGLRRLFDNRTYRGEASWGRSSLQTDPGRIAAGYKRETFQTWRTSWVTIPVPAIVSPELWEAANAPRLQPCSFTTTKPSFLLSGVLRCPDCGRGLRGMHLDRCVIGQHGKKGRPKKGTVKPPRVRERKRFYSCDACNKGGTKHRGATFRLYEAHDLEQPFLAFLRQCVAGPDFLAAVLASQKPHQVSQRPQEAEPDPAATLERLTAREATVIRAQIRAMEAGADSGGYETMLAEIAREKDAARAAIATARARKSGAVAPGRADQLAAQLAAVAGLLERQEVTDPTDPMSWQVRDFINQAVELVEFTLLEPKRPGRCAEWHIGEMRVTLKT